MTLPTPEEYFGKGGIAYLGGYYSVRFVKGSDSPHRIKPNPYEEGSDEYRLWEAGVLEHVNNGRAEWERILEEQQEDK